MGSLMVDYAEKTADDILEVGGEWVCVRERENEIVWTWAP